LWEKKEARAAEQEAQRDRDAVEKRMGEVKLARDEALAREQASRDPVKAAEATLATAQARAAKAARINDFQAAQEALRARADLTPAEQHRVAEYLGRAANASIIRDCDDPKQAIAAGLIASGTRDAKEATKGMEKPDAAKIVEAVEHNREIEKERSRERDLSRDRGRDRGFERSL
jgi:multidrug efflux pump subunit AcrA (membrane-fusion protein)